MKKLIAMILLVTVLSIAAQAYEFEDIDKGYSYSANLYPKGTGYYKFYVSSDELAVFTLKNLNSESDFDLYVYSDPGLGRLIGKSEITGTGTEREIISQSGQYVYLKVVNYGDSFSRFKLYSHEIDFFELAKDALVDTAAEEILSAVLKSIFDVEDDDSEAEQNVGRAATVIMGVFQDKNIAEIGADLLLNEITSRIRDELGYGFWGSFAVNLATSFVKEIYRY